MRSVSSRRGAALVVGSLLAAASCAGSEDGYRLDSSPTIQIRSAGTSSSGYVALATVDVGEDDGARLVVGDVAALSEGRGRVVDRLPSRAWFRDPVWIDSSRVVAIRTDTGDDHVLVEIDVASGVSTELGGPPLTIKDNLHGARHDGTVLVGDVSAGRALSLRRDGEIVGEVPLAGGEVAAILCDDGSVLFADAGNGGRGWSIVHSSELMGRTNLLSVPTGWLSNIGADDSCDRVLVDGTFGEDELRRVWLLEPEQAPVELAIRVGRPAFAGRGVVMTLGTAGVQFCDLPCAG